VSPEKLRRPQFFSLRLKSRVDSTAYENNAIDVFCKLKR
jgi:hypothetical protein